MKSLSRGDDRIAQISSYFRQLDSAIASFQVMCIVSALKDAISIFDMQISSLVNVLDWQKRSDDARVKDQNALHDRLNELKSSHDQLKELLSMCFLPKSRLYAI